MRFCKVCACNIDHKRSDAKYCSVKCANASRKSNASRFCVICGNELISPTPRQKTCSVECSKRNAYLVACGGEKIIPCVICGTYFTKKNRSLTCGKKCSAIHNKNIRHNAYHNKKVLKIDLGTNCVICGEIFHTSTRAKTCSEECRRIRHKQTSRNNKLMNKDRVADTFRRWRMDRYDEQIQRCRDYKELHPEACVKSMLKSQLGFTPPPDLVEEATALRLLRRALKST